MKHAHVKHHDSSGCALRQGSASVNMYFSFFSSHSGFIFIFLTVSLSGLAFWIVFCLHFAPLSVIQSALVEFRNRA